jgi:hypothetical protein
MIYTDLQIKILAELDAYFAETAQEVIEADIDAISQLEFEGSSAEDYFNLFSHYFNTDLLENPTEFGVIDSGFIDSKYVESDKIDVAKLKAA